MSFKLSSYCPMLYAHKDNVHAIQLSTCLFIPKTMVQWRRALNTCYHNRFEMVLRQDDVSS